MRIYFPCSQNLFVLRIDFMLYLFTVTQTLISISTIGKIASSRNLSLLRNTIEHTFIPFVLSNIFVQSVGILRGQSKFHSDLVNKNFDSFREQDLPRLSQNFDLQFFSVLTQIFRKFSSSNTKSSSKKIFRHFFGSEITIFILN